MNRITVEVQGDGTQIWNNVDTATGEEIRYVFTPKSQLSPGDRMEDTERFRRRANGNGLEKITETGQGVLSAPAIAALPNGSFVRLRPGPPRPGNQQARALAPMMADPLDEAEPELVSFAAPTLEAAPEVPSVPKPSTRARRRK